MLWKRIFGWGFCIQKYSQGLCTGEVWWGSKEIGIVVGPTMTKRKKSEKRDTEEKKKKLGKREKKLEGGNERICMDIHIFSHRVMEMRGKLIGRKKEKQKTFCNRSIFIYGDYFDGVWWCHN